MMTSTLSPTKLLLQYFVPSEPQTAAEHVGTYQSACLNPQVNNASVQGAAVDDLRDISRERLERTFNTNVIAMFNLVQVCLMS